MKKSTIIFFSVLIILKVQAQNSAINFESAGDTTGILCRDNDGNIYKTVKIGTQVWMAENLRTTTYNDGTPIPLVTDTAAWSKLLTPGYCWYNNISNNNIYGALYNCFTISTGKLAPVGWHVATDEEWTILTTYLGGEKIAGAKLKVISKNYWNWLNEKKSTNESGFTALPAGHRDNNGIFSLFGNGGYWWSSSEYGSTGKVWYRSMDINSSGIFRANNNKKNGHSVRCVMDAISLKEVVDLKPDLKTGVPFVVTPKNPSGFIATRTFTGDIILKWNPVTNAIYYNLQGAGIPQGLLRPGAVVNNTVNVTGTTYTIKGLLAGTHSWILYAVFNDTSGSYFADKLNPAKTSLTINANPSGFKATQNIRGDVILTWNSVPNVINYNLQGAGVQPASVMGTTYTVKGLQAGTHSWWLFAVYNGPDGPYFGDELNPARTSLTINIAPGSSPRWTGFDPEKHGFRFVNSFTNNVIGPPISFETHGLCGGMSYTMLDYYNAGRPIPNQEYRPANNTLIQKYLYDRQVNSLTPNIDKWLEVNLNPLGMRTDEFFNWGIKERLQELRSFIDRGVPVVLGLKGTEGTIHDHQVIAIGYDAGRYQGDLGNYKEDIRIFICDPNYPTGTQTLVPNPITKDYYYLDHTDDRWRTYFVDNKYAFVNPPNIMNPGYLNDGLIHELLFKFTTGADDMRGGPDHVDVTVKLKDNTSQYYPNVSQNGRWLPNYMETAQLVLRQPIAQGTISSIEVSTNAANNITGDNWDLLTVEIKAIIGGYNGEMLISSAGPWRFTGARIPLVINVR